MLQKYPNTNEYWEDKRAKVEDIDVPVYVVASHSSNDHTAKSLRGYEDIKHDQIW
jgi:predicted acyl esterase